MSYLVPRLTNGMSSGQSIMEVKTTPLHDPGTRAVLPDGRVFYYAANRGSAIAVGKLLKATEIDADFEDIDVDTMTAGATQLTTVTAANSATATTYAANELAGGYVIVQDDTGEGYTHRIMGNASWAYNTSTTLTIEPPVQVTFASTTTLCIVPNPYSRVAISDNNETQLIVGATVRAIPAGSTDVQYFWAQTWGVCAVQDGAGSIAIGQALSANTTAGNTVAAAEGAGTFNQVVGINLFTSTSGEHMPVFLQIAP